MAPELILPVEEDKFEYDEKIDVWAIGVITYYLMAEGKFPFPGKKKAVVDNLILNVEPSYEFDGTETHKDFIRQCLCKDRHNRPSID